MGNSTKSLTISQVALTVGVNVETIRYYQRRGLIQQPPKPLQGYRLYPPETQQRLRFVKRSQELGFTLVEIESLLELGDGRCHETQTLAEHKLGVIKERIRDLKAMEKALQRLVLACGQHEEDTGCPLVETLTHWPEA